MALSFDIPPTVPTFAVLGFGYGNKPITALENFFAKYPKTVLIDVRRNPRSQWNVNYNRKALEARFGIFTRGVPEINGHRYWFAGTALGNGLTKDQAELTGGGWLIPPPYDLEATIMHLDGIRTEMDRLGATPMFMCGCGNQHECHRRFIIQLALFKVWTDWTYVDVWGKP